MELRLNIVLSAVFHGMVIIASFLLVRGGTLSGIQAASPLNVSFFAESSENAAPRQPAVRKETKMVSQKLLGPVQKEKMEKAVVDSDTKPELRALEPHVSSEASGKGAPADTGGVEKAAPGTPPAPASKAVQAWGSESLRSVPQTTSVFLNSAADVPASGKIITHGGAVGIPDAIAAIRSALERAKSYPPVAKKRGIEGTVTASFTINGGGFPENIRIVKSSGYEVLDAAAWGTVQKAAPFPAIQGLIEVPITFMLR